MMPAAAMRLRDPDTVIRGAFAAANDGLWIAPRFTNTMFQDAAMSTPWASAGDPVGAILDSSGFGHTFVQATSAARPLGHVGRLQGDGVDDNLSGGDILDIGTGSLFGVVVAKFDTTASGQFIFGKSSGSVVGGRYSILRRGTGNLAAQFAPVGSVLNADAAIETSTDLRVLSIVVDRVAGQLKLRINGVEITVTSWTPSFGDLNNSINYQLFANHSGAQFFDGDIHELIQVMRTPLAGEIEGIEARLAAAHGVSL